MKRSRSVLLFTITAITTIFLAATTAQAVGYYPIPTVPVNTLNGVNGLVDIGEFVIDDFFDGPVPGDIEEDGMEASGGYFVHVHGVEVFGFAVYPYTNRDGWYANFISAEAWDAGQVIGLLGPLLTTDIGGFSSLFGDDEYANLYYNVDGDNITDGSDTDHPPFPSNPFEAEFFFSGGEMASDFVAFTQTGSPIDHSRALQPIPEPSTFFLFGTGIVGLIAHTLRKKSGIKA